jgi:hypothetical protein
LVPLHILGGCHHQIRIGCERQEPNFSESSKTMYLLFDSIKHGEFWKTGLRSQGTFFCFRQFR